jgi:hypothetical protein
MKKLFGLVLVLMFVFSVNVLAAETTKTITFGWTQEDTTNLKEWKIFWSDTAGGPYTEVAIIPYNSGEAGPEYTGSKNMNVSGNQGTHVTKYFIVRACGDIPQEDGTVAYSCSADSNEVSYAFWVPAGTFSIPLEFKIMAAERD